MLNKTEQRKAMAQGRSLKRTGQAMWFAACIIIALSVWAVASVITFVTEDAIRVERTLKNNE